ncbi:MAG: hypothetical protein PHE20_00850 [Patescibacteria group bacterium]|nr:hypothetical protein [Patescibacteria group bacterium]
MFKFFHKAEGASPKEPISSSKEILSDELNDEEAVADMETLPLSNEKAETVGSVLDKLHQVMLIKQELGTNLSPAEVEQVTGMSLEDFAEFLNGEKVDIQTNGGEFMKTMQSAMDATEGEMKEGTLRKFSKNKIVRVAFVTLMLLLKFAPQTQGAEAPANDKDNNKTEKSFDQKNNIEPDNTYQLTPDDLDKGDKNNLNNKLDAKALEVQVNVFDSGRGAQFDLTNYFDTDSDHIPEQVEAKISADFDNFLSQINADNIDDILNSQLVIYGSSDERPTTNWNGENHELTAARLAAADKTLRAALQGFSFDGIPVDKVEALKAMAFKHEMPHSTTGPEVGVTYITDNVNPDSPDGSNFTAAEVEDMKINNPDKYKQLLDDNRKIVFKVVVNNENKIQPMEPKTAKLEVPGASIEDITPHIDIERLGEYENVSLLFDNSPSVALSHNYMADVIAKQDIKDVKVNFAVFSDEKGKSTLYNDAEELASAIKDIKHDGSQYENAVSSAIDAINELPGDQKNAVFIITDERLQDVSGKSLSELEKAAGEHNADVFFYYADSKGTVLQISIDDMKAAYEKSVYNMMAPKIASELSLQENKVAALEKILGQHEDKLTKLEKLAQKGSSETYQKNYQAAQERALALKSDIDQNKSELETLRSTWEDKSFNDMIASDVIKGMFDGKNGHLKIDKNFVAPINGKNMGLKSMQMFGDRDADLLAQNKQAR